MPPQPYARPTAAEERVRAKLSSKYRQVLR
jgi:hypothetical protein